MDLFQRSFCWFFCNPHDLILYTSHLTYILFQDNLSHSCCFKYHLKPLLSSSLALGWSFPWAPDPSGFLISIPRCIIDISKSTCLKMDAPLNSTPTKYSACVSCFRKCHYQVLLFKPDTPVPHKSLISFFFSPQSLLWCFYLNISWIVPLTVFSWFLFYLRRCFLFLRLMQTTFWLIFLLSSWEILIENNLIMILSKILQSHNIKPKYIKMCALYHIWPCVPIKCHLLPFLIV